MNVLLAYRYHDWVVARWLERAFAELGHEVRTMGPTIGARALELPTSGPRLDVMAAYKHLSSERWTPQMLLVVESGTLYPVGISRLPIPTAYYSIDTDISPALHSTLGRLYDVVFVSQRGDMPIMREAGCSDVRWLPLACDPALADDSPATDEFDVVQIGTMYPHRQRVLDRAADRFRVLADTVPPERQCAVYRRGRVGLNVSRRREVNGRVWEILSFGVPLLTDYDPPHGLLELFDDGRHLVTFETADECFDRLGQLVEDQDLRSRIAAEGRAEVLAKHTWRHRAEAVVDALAGIEPSERQSTLGETYLLAKAKAAQSRLGVRTPLGAPAPAREPVS